MKISIYGIAILASLFVWVGQGFAQVGPSTSSVAPQQRYVLVVRSFPEALYVNLPFSVTIERRDRWTGLPAPVTQTQIVTVTNLGGGVLQGSTQEKMLAGSAEVTFSGLTLSQLGSVFLEFRISNNAALTVKKAAFVRVHLVGPNYTVFCTTVSPMPPSTFFLRDGLGDPYLVTGEANWSLLQGESVIQSGSVSLVAQSEFQISPATVASGSYLLQASLALDSSATDSVPVQTLTDFPGPVAILRSGRVASSYSETVADYVTGAVNSYHLAQALPAGLSLDANTGALSGTPTTAGTTHFFVMAQVGSNFKPIRCTLSIFTAEESEFISGQNFGFSGATPPYTSTQLNTTVTSLDNTFDNNFPSFQLRIHHPAEIAGITQPMPLLLYHHGRGFDHTEYNDILGRVARWGMICVSSGDYYSFYGNSQPGYAGPQPYEPSGPNPWAEAGMESGSGTQEALLRYFIIRNRTVGDVFYGKIDERRLFVGGHSRGGGATHASQSRGFLFTAAANPPQIPVAEKFGIAGYVGLMPFDLWYFIRCQPPLVPLVPAGPGAMPYNVPKDLRQIPGLIFAAENDGDLIYPICDQMIERRTTSTCFLTIWGANHNYTGDAHANEQGGAPAITAATQRNILVQWMTAFLLRFGYDRLDLEDHLFGDEYTQSSQVGHVYERDLSSKILVYDVQGSLTTNNLGQPNTTSGTGITATQTNPYPSIGSLPNAQPRSLRLTFTNTGAGKFWQTGLGNLDTSHTKRFLFELRQSGTQGFSWISLGVTLTDSEGASATVQIYDHVSTPDVSSYLPIYPIPGFTSARPLNRFLQVEVPLNQFSGVNLNSLSSARFEINNGNTSNNIMIDDIRFE